MWPIRNTMAPPLSLDVVGVSVEPCGRSLPPRARSTARVAGASRASVAETEGGGMDDDLDHMSREQLMAEARKLRQGIREHRDSSGHDLCWHHPALWSLLPEQSDPLPLVPDWPQFLRGCIRYRESLDEQAPNAPRTDEPFRG
jgi:hypothetical protein